MGQTADGFSCVAEGLSAPWVPCTRPYWLLSTIEAYHLSICNPPQSQFCNRNRHDIRDVYSRRILARNNRSADHSIPSGCARQPASARARRALPHTGRARAAVNPMTIPPPARSDGRMGCETVQAFGAGQAPTARPFLRRSATLVIIFSSTGRTPPTRRLPPSPRGPRLQDTGDRTL